MASSKAAISTVLDTVVGTATAVCTTINMLGKSATYGSKWMDKVLANQTIQLAVDADIFESTYVEMRSMELTQQRAAINAYVEANPAHKTIYEQSLAQLQAAVAKVKP